MYFGQKTESLSRGNLPNIARLCLFDRISTVSPSTTYMYQLTYLDYCKTIPWVPEASPPWLSIAVSLLTYHTYNKPSGTQITTHHWNFRWRVSLAIFSRFLAGGIRKMGKMYKSSCSFSFTFVNQTLHNNSEAQIHHRLFFRFKPCA